jgi:patatin-like phospholipase/acyl hydrolase
MAIHFTTEASLDFATLQQTINEEEKNVFVRLTSLIGKTESSTKFNAHVYESVDDNTLPLSKIFSIPDGGSAANDPTVKTWLELNPTQQIRYEEMVYISGSLTKIAVVR